MEINVFFKYYKFYEYRMNEHATLFVSVYLPVNNLWAYGSFLIELCYLYKLTLTALL